jgi:hypothetical protein
MPMIGYVLFVAAAFPVVMLLVAVYMRRVADVALTDQFRAAETMVDGRVPDQWVLQINRRIAWGSRLPLCRRGVSGMELLLAKIDKLYRFYERSPFFENEGARELLLTQLRETRERWGKMTWEELVSQHNGGARPDTSGD